MQIIDKTISAVLALLISPFHLKQENKNKKNKREKKGSTRDTVDTGTGT
jgi:hypothetical protein